MITKTVLLASLFLFSFSPLLASAQPDRCDSGNRSLTAYMRRQNDDRCEGILSSNRSSSGLDLFSLTLGSVQRTGDGKLFLQVPAKGGQQPSVTITSLEDRNGKKKFYQLKPLTLHPTASQFEFGWSPKEVLDKENIDYASLRAIARTNSGVYLPVLFGGAGKKAYTIVLISDRPVKIKSFRILDHKGKVVYSESGSDYDPGEISFTWNGRRADRREAPTGRYRISVDAALKHPSESGDLNLPFEHNPQWLR